MAETMLPPAPHACEWETLDGGPPQFRTNRQLWFGERAHVRCRVCRCRTFITREEWAAQHPATEAEMQTAEDEAREREIATARRFLELHGHAVIDMRNRDASVVPIGVDFPRDAGGDD